MWKKPAKGTLVTRGKTSTTQLELKVLRFLAVLLLRNKDQQYNNPLASFATCLCWQWRGHEGTAISSLADTTAVNLVLVQCQRHEGK